MAARKTLNGFLDELASATPAPGGGSVAALAGALGAALTSMVCNLTIGKKKYAGVEQEMKKILVESEKLRATFTALVAQGDGAPEGAPRGGDPRGHEGGDAGPP